MAGVVKEYREAFPQAEIVVIDNASTDLTAARAREAGARVLHEPRKGKGRAVLAAFGAVETDLVLMVDGDGSYPAEGGMRLLEHFSEHPCDMLTGIRCAVVPQTAFRPMHQFGTKAFAWWMRRLFQFDSKDVFSGLRLFSKEFYKNVPILSRGFELEMELTIQAIDKGFRVAEVEVPFRDREAGTHSKLNTVRDGLRILRVLMILFRDYRPFACFGAAAFACFILSLLAGCVPVLEYFNTGMVNHFPLAILAAALMNLAMLVLFTGLILQSQLRAHREAFQVRMR